jgi:hypothetical protein
MKQTIEDILEIFRAEAARNHDLGDKFERLIAACLTKVPYWPSILATSGSGWNGRARPTNPTPPKGRSPQNRKKCQ